MKTDCFFKSSFEICKNEKKKQKKKSKNEHF